MPSVYYVVDETYEPPEGSLKEKIIEEIKKHPGEHSSRTLAVRLGIKTEEEFEEFLHHFHWLIEKGIIRGTWRKMELYLERVVKNPNKSVTVEEILEGTELAIKHAKAYGRTWKEAEEELRMIKRFVK